jgi:hypothetical protein
MQWQWMMDELTSAKQNGEKVSHCVATQTSDKKGISFHTHLVGLVLELPRGKVGSS